MRRPAFLAHPQKEPPLFTSLTMDDVARLLGLVIAVADEPKKTMKIPEGATTRRRTS